MKKIILGLSSLCLFASATFAQKPGTEKHAPAKASSPKAVLVNAAPPKAVTAASPKPAIDSFSYALGMNVAKNLKQQGITSVVYASMQKGMQDAYSEKATILSEQQANACIQTKLTANAGKKLDAEKAKGKAFLDKNKKRPEVVTTASGLQYEVIKKGDASGPSPKLADTVVAHYAGTLIDGKEFDNSYKRGEPLTIGVGSVIKGWTEALQLMHVGDKWKVYIPSEIGYGDRGAGADIPGGATLIFEMELLQIKPSTTAAEK